MSHQQKLRGVHPNRDGDRHCAFHNRDKRVHTRIYHVVKTAEWAAYSLAAHSLAMQRIEQTRAAKWDPAGFPPVDDLTNRPPAVDILDIPISGTNIAYATSITTIATVSLNPPLKKIRVECVWPFVNRGLFTNVVVTYRAPDQ